jgi:ParB-like chromosome segregation protein Spo0J
VDRASIGRGPARDDGRAPGLAAADAAKRKFATVPVLSLRRGESPRLDGEDKAHIARLAESETPWPPILVDRRTMRVIDGMHRLMAASLKGQETIEVEFFDGDPADAYIRGVYANVLHGLPLSLADRRAAAARIIALHPQMSDRTVAETAGLAARTVASIRRSSASGGPQLNDRVGKDGKVRPINGREGRQRAAALLAEHPAASLREVARDAGVSPATVRDVRLRLARGEEPVPGRSSAPPAESAPAPLPPPRLPAPRLAPDAQQANSVATVAAGNKLACDPSLRHTEHGRLLMHLLQLNAVAAQEWPGVVAAVPPHCTTSVMQLARQYGQMWLGVAQELDERSIHHKAMERGAGQESHREEDHH